MWSSNEISAITVAKSPVSAFSLLYYNYIGVDDDYNNYYYYF